MAGTGQKRNRKGTVRSGGGDGSEDSGNELHIWTERERRKRMRNMFSNLHSLLPQLPLKADKSTIVEEAVRYVKVLEHTLQTLENQRLERLTNVAVLDYQTIPTNGLIATSNYDKMQPSPGKIGSVFPACFKTWSSPNVVVNMCGDDAQISVCSPKKLGLLTTIFYILHKHHLNVVSAHISSDQYRCFFMIHAHAGGGCSDQVLEGMPVEEKFKLALGEMNLWILNCCFNMK